MKTKDCPGFLESLGARLEIQFLPSLSHMALPNIQIAPHPQSVSWKQGPYRDPQRAKSYLSNAVRIKKQILGLNPQLCASMPTSTQAGMSFHAYVVVWKSKKHRQRDRVTPLLQLPRSRRTFHLASRQLGSQLSVPVWSRAGSRAAFLPCDCPSLGHAR